VIPLHLPRDNKPDLSGIPPLSSEPFPLPFSATSSLPSSASLLPFFVVFPSLLSFSLSSPVSFSLLPLPLFLLSALPIVAPLPPRALPLLPVFVLQAPAHTFHHWNPTPGQR